MSRVFSFHSASGALVLGGSWMVCDFKVGVILMEVIKVLGMSERGRGRACYIMC